MKKTVYNKLNTKVNSLQKKIPHASTLIQTSQYNTDNHNLDKKIGDVGNKIPDISDLATTAVLDTKIGNVENEIPDVSGLVKKSDSDTKISYIEKKYFTASDYNKFITDILHGKIKEKELVDKSYIYNLVKNSDLNAKVATLATKAELKSRAR